MTKNEKIIKKIKLKKEIIRCIEEHFKNHRGVDSDAKLERFIIQNYSHSTVKMSLFFSGYMPDVSTFYKQNHYKVEDKVVSLVNEYKQL